jgi:hypothetical protein
MGIWSGEARRRKVGFEGQLGCCDTERQPYLRMERVCVWRLRGCKLWVKMEGGCDQSYPSAHEEVLLDDTACRRHM